VSLIDGLAAGSMREIEKMERAEQWPGATADALARWRRTVHRPDLTVRLQEEERRLCPCCDLFGDRDLLDEVLGKLGPRARRELSAKIQPLDDLYQRRTIPAPHSSANRPWWRQRA
jgi:hypothetical protein